MSTDSNLGRVLAAAGAYLCRRDCGNSTVYDEMFDHEGLDKLAQAIDDVTERSDDYVDRMKALIRNLTEKPTYEISAYGLTTLFCRGCDIRDGAEHYDDCLLLRANDLAGEL